MKSGGVIFLRAVKADLQIVLKVLRRLKYRIDMSSSVSPPPSLRVGAIRVERNRLELDETTGIEHAVGSGNKDETVDCGMILGSIGYRCLPVEGVPYDDQKSIIANKG